jgi:hypothetical protein
MDRLIKHLSQTIKSPLGAVSDCVGLKSMSPDMPQAGTLAFILRMAWFCVLTQRQFLPETLNL